jgi:MFS family permease
LGSRFLGVFSGGAIEALGPFIVSECFLEKQLARAIVVYVGFLAAGSSIGPILAGAVASGLHSCRWFFGIISIAIGVNLISCNFMLQDTTHIIDDFSEKNLNLDPDKMEPPNQSEFVNEPNGRINSECEQSLRSL